MANSKTNPNSIEDVDLGQIQKRSLAGMATLTGGGLINILISTCGLFFITAYLSPAEYAVYGLVLSVIAILGYFSDIGLAASLIQKKDTPSDTDLQTTFTIQQILVVSLVVLALCFSSVLQQTYALGQQEMWLFYAVLLSFFLSSLKSISSVLLERVLRFDLITIVRIIENLLFNIITVVMALKGFGILSYVPAVLAQGLVGTALIFYFKPWNMTYRFSLSSVKSLLKFGLPYQINSFLAVAKDQLMNLVLWKIINPTGMGYINWGIQYSQMPQRMIMDNATKIAFPAMSRIQDYDQEFKTSAERLIKFLCLMIFPSLVMIAFGWSHLVFLLDKWHKWQPALPVLYLFCFSAAMSCLSTPIFSFFYALGRTKINFGLMLMWLILEWAFKPILAVKFGFLGIGYAAAIISVFSWIPLVIFAFQAKASIVKMLFTPVAITSVMLSLGLLTHGFGLIVNLGLMAVSFGLVFILDKTLITDIKPFYAYVKSKF